MNIYKPTLLISNNVPLSAKQLDVYNYLLKEAYNQLDQDHTKTIFEYSVTNLKEHFSYLDSIRRVKDFFNTLFDEEFNFNLLNKDKYIKSKIKSRFISSIEDKGDGVFRVSLEPHSINAMKLLIMKKKNIPLPINEQLSSYAKLEFEDMKDFKFYPSKVMYEILKDYKEKNIPLIELEIFKEATHTTNKFQKDYKTKVLKRIEEDLALKNILIKIEFKKQGRRNKRIKITKIKKEELKIKSQITRKQIIDKAKKTFGIKYLKEMSKEQKTILNISLKNNNFKLCK